MDSELPIIFRRQSFDGCPDGYYRRGSYCYRYSLWDSVLRWVVLGLAFLVFFVLLFCCLCVNARRRKSRGMPPRYGTGWMAPHAGAHNNNPEAYYMQNQNQPPPPAYGAPSYGPGSQPYGNDASGYYGAGVQSPQNVYQPHSNDYSPPAGPPPGK